MRKREREMRDERGCEVWGKVSRISFRGKRGYEHERMSESV